MATTRHRFREAYCHRVRRRQALASLTPLQRLAFGSQHRLVGDSDEYYGIVMNRLNLLAGREYSSYVEELVSIRELRTTYLDAVGSGRIPSKWRRYEHRIMKNPANVVNYYALIRELKPSIVVETGTASGSMTSWLLAALALNGSGTLVSIDLPPTAGRLTMEETIAPEDIGFLVPREFRESWLYLKGDAKVLLPKILAEETCQVFVHDSLHTRTHMSFEYHVARALLPPHALLISDDILWNGAWFDFLRTHQLNGLGHVSNPNLGLTVNEFSENELSIGIGIVADSAEMEVE